MGVPQGHALGALEDLDHRLVMVDLYDTAETLLASYVDLADLVEGRILQPLQYDQGPVDAIES